MKRFEIEAKMALADAAFVLRVLERLGFGNPAPCRLCGSSLPLQSHSPDCEVTRALGIMQKACATADDEVYDKLKESLRIIGGGGM